MSCHYFCRLSRKNRILKDFAAERRRIVYEAHRHGIHGPRFGKIVTPIPIDEDPLIDIVNDTNRTP